MVKMPYAEEFRWAVLQAQCTECSEKANAPVINLSERIPAHDLL